MNTLRILAAAAMLTAAAAPATAADLIFKAEGKPEILASFDGRPYWEIQAYCAGFHGATANWYSRSGETSKASASEQAGVAAFTRSVARLRSDRGIDEKTAVPLVESALRVGGRRTTEALRADGMHVRSQWNYWRSFCIDAEAYFLRTAG